MLGARYQDIKAGFLFPLLRNLVQIDQGDNDLVSMLPAYLVPGPGHKYKNNPVNLINAMLSVSA